MDRVGSVHRALLRLERTESATAKARVAGLNAHCQSHTTDPAERYRRGQRKFAERSADRLASRRVKVVNGQVKARTLDEYARLLDCYVMPGLGHVPIAEVSTAAQASRSVTPQRQSRTGPFAPAARNDEGKRVHDQLGRQRGPHRGCAG